MSVMEASEKVSSVRSSHHAVVTFTMQDFFVSQMQHYITLKKAIERNFRGVASVHREEGRINGGFDISIRLQSSGKTTEIELVGQSQKPRTGRLLFSKLREGYYPTAMQLVEAMNHCLRADGAMKLELDKVQCAFICSSPEHIHIFKRLVNHTTSQLIGQVSFDFQMVPVSDVLEIWVNGSLLYSLWSCLELPVLHDVICELDEVAKGRQFNPIPRLRSVENYYKHA